MAQLFSITTDQVTLVWSRRKAKQPFVTPDSGAPPFGLIVDPLRRDEAPVVEIQTVAVSHLFEQTDYTVFVQSLSGQPAHLRHRDPVLVQGLHCSDDGRVVHGTVNFGTQVGRSQFVVEVGDHPSFSFAVEVFPSKLDYRHDFAMLRDDVQQIAQGLALEYLRSTYAPGLESTTRYPEGTTWVVLLRHIMDDLEQALGHITRQPHWGTGQAVLETRTERVRRPDAVLMHTINRRGGRGSWQHLEGGVLVRSCLPAKAPYYTLDTPEHRWLAGQLRMIRRRLAALLVEEASRYSGPRRQQIHDELEALQHRIVRLERLAPLAASEGPLPFEPPLRLMTAPGYREAYRACLWLRQGLHLEGGPLHPTLKDLHVLYEYWCFLTIVRLVGAQTGYHEAWRSLLRVERNGLHVRLRKGRLQTVSFRLGDGRRIDLTYNPRFGGKGYLVPQQPDILLTVYPPSGPATLYILDAKYRLDASPAYVRRYGFPGPPADALNTLHRYRDAIRGSAGRTVAQAVALFPYREEEPGHIEASRHWRSLGEIGVGAIPLLPGHTAYLARWLRGVIGLGDD